MKVTLADREEENAFVHGFYGLPNEKAREAMSVVHLAELLAQQQHGSVAQLVLSHELNLKIAKLQSKATLNAGRLGAGATVVSCVITFLLGYFVGTSSGQSTGSAAATAPAATASQSPSSVAQSPMRPQQPSASTSATGTGYAASLPVRGSTP